MNLKTKEQIYLIIKRGSLQQKLVCVLLGLISTIVSCEQFAVNFLTPYQNFWCHVPELQNCTDVQQQNLIAPWKDESNKYGFCSIRKLNWTNYEESCIMDESIEASNETCTSGFQFDNTLFIQTVTSRFGLVCDKSWIHEMLTPIYLSGLVIGSFIGGIISDGYGRKLSMFLFIIVHAIGCAIASFGTNVWLFLAGRVLIAISLRGVGYTALTLLIEIFPSKNAETSTLFFQYNYVIGQFVAITFGYFIRDYRSNQLGIGLLYLLFCLCWPILPESPSWLLSKDKFEAALRELKRFSCWANLPFPDDLLQEYMEMKITNSESDIVKDKNFTNKKEVLTVFDLFRYKKLAFYTMAVFCGSLSLNSSYLGAAFNMGLLFGDVFTNMTISASMELVAIILFTFIYNKIGRKPLMIIFSLMQFLLHVAQIILVLIPSYDMAVTIVALSCKLITIPASAVLFIFAAELFPTSLRSQAIGVGNALSGILICFAPIIGGSLKLIWAPLPNIIFGFFSFLTVIIYIFVPETFGRKLPETIEEVLSYKQGDRKRKLSNVKSVDEYIFESETIGTYYSLGI